MRKGVAVAFVVLALTAGCLAIVNPILAQTKPSVPEFSVKIVDTSYDVPTTYSLDKYTGQIVAIDGYHIQRNAIEVTIKTQPFTASISGSDYSMYYNVNVKNHFNEEWTELVNLLEAQTNSEGTTFANSSHYSAGTQLDFQVKATLGRYYTYYSPGRLQPVTERKFDIYGASDWSNVQTVTVPEASPSPTSTLTLTPSPSPTAQLTFLPAQTASPTVVVRYVHDPLSLTLSIVAVATSMVTLGALIYSIKHSKNK